MFKSLIGSIFSQPNRPIIIHDSDHTCIQLHYLDPFCLLVGQLDWVKTDLIRGLNYLAAVVTTLVTTLHGHVLVNHCIVKIYAKVHGTV